MDLMSMLKSSQLFANLSEEELQAVARCTEERAVPARTTVITEDSPGDSLFLVRTGKVKVERNRPTGKLLLAELGPGAAFGEMSLIDAIPTSATVTTLEDTSLLVIGRLNLNVLLNWNTVLASKMWRSFTLMLSRRLRETNDRVLERYGADAIREG